MLCPGNLLRPAPGNSLRFTLARLVTPAVGLARGSGRSVPGRPRPRGSWSLRGRTRGGPRLRAAGCASPSWTTNHRQVQILSFHQRALQRPLPTTSRSCRPEEEKHPRPPRGSPRRRRPSVLPLPVKQPGCRLPPLPGDSCIRGQDLFSQGSLF